MVLLGHLPLLTRGASLNFKLSRFEEYPRNNSRDVVLSVRRGEYRDTLFAPGEKNDNRRNEKASHPSKSARKVGLERGI